MKTAKSTAVCLMGPTASGKTQLAVQLVQQFPFEIISVDSAMVYRGMDIGTAKPDAAILAIASHQLINIRDPQEAYSAAHFRKDALAEIEAIQARGKIPLLVGGTMLYFHALQHGIATMPSANAELRLQLSREAEQQGWPALHHRLAKVDPIAAERIHPHDSQRIQRALEVHELTGENLSTWQKNNEIENNSIDFYNIAVSPQDRSVLHARIQQRFLHMLEQGFVEEVETLFSHGDLTISLPAIRSVGYRQIWSYLEGKYTYTEMQEKSIIATRQLAKRQLTWLRSWSDAVWFDSEEKEVLNSIIIYLKEQKVI